jgi:cytosine/adenosine deaminase-related metal-dependent hydrolase
MALRPGESTGRRIFETALAGGARALQQPISAIAPGRRADIVLLDSDHPDLAPRRDDGWLDAWIFVVGRPAVRTVLAGGEVVVETGRHIARPTIESRYRAVVAGLSGCCDIP